MKMVNELVHGASQKREEKGKKGGTLFPYVFLNRAPHRSPLAERFIFFLPRPTTYMSSLNKSVRSLTPPHLILILNPKAVDPRPTKSPDQSSEVKKNETLFATHLRRRNKQIPLDLHPFPSFFRQNLLWPFLITTLHHIAAVRSNTNHQPPISNDACVVTIGRRVSMNSTRTQARA